MASALMDQLLADIKTAMKAQDGETVMALRTLNAAIKDQTVNAGVEVTDEAVVAVVSKAIKQRADAIEQFAVAGRQDLVDKEQKQVDLYRKYQPKQLDRAEIEVLVRECIAASGAASKKEMGKVMPLLMPKVKGRADGKLVNQVVLSLLP
ncbi:MAG TPA: GatB/YqeY domain-containing protein [Kiritimatiellia bacterium]|nr:GatB/YqeY domain-containing protein [Kiritimatiellia bacterium]HPS06258.1 GatB/YqeY domain-containing protein [Kiritimatiellia bacterium]